MKRFVVALIVLSALLCALPTSQPDSAVAAPDVGVLVRILRYEETVCPDDDVFEPCPGDYYAKIAIHDSGLRDTTRAPDDTNPYNPTDWTRIRTVDKALGTIQIAIELHDHDDEGVGDIDEWVDISPLSGDRQLNVTLDLNTGSWTGDNGSNQNWARGAGDDSSDGRADVLFDIEISPPADTDQDGILDRDERFGIGRDLFTGAVAVDLGNPGNFANQAADPCRKTILLEIDWMQGAPDGHNHRPKQAAINEIVAAFNNSPVAAITPCPWPGFGATGGVQLMIDVSNSLPETQVLSLGSQFDNMRDGVGAGNFNAARRPYFHYAIFAHEHTFANNGSSGRCCEDTSDLIVSLGEWRDTCIGPGPDNTLNTAIATGDAPSGNGLFILHGADRDCDTDRNAGSDDVQFVGPICVGPGVDGALTSPVAAGDQLVAGVFGNTIQWGTDRDCDSTANNVDAQVMDVGAPVADFEVGTVRDQSSTLMHELGHALGIEHRGDAEVNFTPNYLSVMNYAFQNAGGIPFSNAPGAQLDYSRSALPTIDEALLDENKGIQGPANFNTFWFDPTGNQQLARASGPIDWNQASGIEPFPAVPPAVPVSVDLNGDSLCVGPGGNGAFETTPAPPDDAIANGFIHNGPDDICQTRPAVAAIPANQDVQIFASNGTPINQVCIWRGKDEQLDSTRANDDGFYNVNGAVLGITHGNDLVCDSTKADDDIQVTPVGKTEPRPHPGFDDWSNIHYRGGSGGSGAGAGHEGDATFEDALRFQFRLLQLLEPDLKATKTVDNATPSPGTTLNYTVKAENIGTGEASKVRIVDTLPNGTVVTRTPANIIAGQSATETFTFAIPCGTPDGTVYVNSVTMSAKDLQTAPETNTSNNSASASATVAAPVLTMTKTATESVNAGEAITYRLTYENTGSGGAASVTIVDTLPAGVYYSTALDLGAGPKPNSVVFNADGTRTLTWNIGAVAGKSGANVVEFTARPTLLALGGTGYTNRARLTYTDAGGCTYPPVDAQDDTTITVVPPSRDPQGLGFWRTHPELETAEILARIQATDVRFDGADGASPDGALTLAEVDAVLVPGGNMDKVLEEQLIATYFNLATRRINAGTLIESRTADRLGLNNVADAAYYAMRTLLLPVNSANRARYSNITRVLDEINLNKNEVY